MTDIERERLAVPQTRMITRAALKPPTYRYLLVGLAIEESLIPVAVLPPLGSSLPSRSPSRSRCQPPLLRERERMCRRSEAVGVSSPLIIHFPALVLLFHIRSLPESISLIEVSAPPLMTTAT